MNDHELITVLREHRSKVHMTIPVEQIISRGRAVRAWRRIPGLAGALAVVAAAAVTATMLLGPASHQASRQPTVRLAAWTVARLADGNIYVRVRELRDLTALQRRLRADGLPASVIAAGQRNPCQPYPAAAALLTRVFPVSYRLRPPPPDNVIVIRRSALPGNAGVQLSASFRQSPAMNGVAAPVLVYAGPHCTSG
jgi:hypothetical protein